MNQTNLKNQLEVLQEKLGIFLQEVKVKKLSLMATEQWTVKDILCHIVSWHEYYAANYKALAEGKEPPLYEGSTATRNLETVRELRKHQVNDLISRLWKANKILERSIIKGKVKRMTYKKDGRVYETSDFLDMITRHIITHTKHVKRTK